MNHVFILIMAAIKCNRVKTYGTLGLDEDAPQTSRTSEEVEYRIKELVQKQLQPFTTIQKSLEGGRNFHLASEYVSVSGLSTGKLSFREYQELETASEKLAFYKECSLVEDEICLLSQLERGELREKRRDAAVRERLSRIWAKLRRKSVQEIRNDIPPSVNDEGQSEKARQLNFLVRQEKSTVQPRRAGRDVELLSYVEKELTKRVGGLSTPSVAPSKRIKKVRGNDVPSAVGPSRRRSLWDATRPIAANESKFVTVERPSRLYTNRNGVIVPLDSAAENPQITEKNLPGQPFVLSDYKDTISLDYIRKHRMSVIDLKKIPRFANYSCGNISKKLYIKNLAGGTKETDLTGLFSNFQSKNKPKIIFQLCTGRMKGQAFVTFSDIEDSQEALEELNGYMLRGKPMVIEYGKI